LVQEKDEKIVSLENRNTIQQEQIHNLQKQLDRISVALEELRQASPAPRLVHVSSINAEIR